MAKWQISYKNIQEVTAVMFEVLWLRLRIANKSSLASTASLLITVDLFIRSTVHHIFYADPHGSAEMCAFPGNEELCWWWLVYFTLLRWHLLLLPSSYLCILNEVRFVNVNATRNSKHCSEDHVSKGYSPSIHVFCSLEPPMVKHKLTLKQEHNCCQTRCLYRLCRN